MTDIKVQHDNGHLRARAIAIIAGDEATQHEKLDLLLQIVLDLDDRQKKIRHDVNSNPLVWIPVTWRKRVAMSAGAWIGWVSLNVAGVPLGIDAIWEFISKYL